VAAYYAAAARNEGIESSLQFALPGELDDTVESDLCIIVGNLLENAVEACRRMENGARFIRLNSRLEYGTLTITADNSFNGNIWEKDGVFLSSKREGEGVGLSSVAAVAKKYGGRARFEAKDGVFQASVYVRLGDDIW
jgi:sensor histidine kinase regulating citrate/malate metabolism